MPLKLPISQSQNAKIFFFNRSQNQNDIFFKTIIKIKKRKTSSERIQNISQNQRGNI